jgi:hypothetical protein
LVPRSSNNSDSRVYPRSQKFHSGLGVQTFSGQDQLEIESSDFQTITVESFKKDWTARVIDVTRDVGDT